MAVAASATTTATYADRRPGLVARISKAFAVRRLENGIFDELNALSDRDLADIGLQRTDLRNVARKAALAA